MSHSVICMRFRFVLRTLHKCTMLFNFDFQISDVSQIYVNNQGVFLGIIIRFSYNRIDKFKLLPTLQHISLTPIQAPVGVSSLAVGWWVLCSVVLILPGAAGLTCPDARSCYLLSDELYIGFGAQDCKSHTDMQGFFLVSPGF